MITYFGDKELTKQLFNEQLVDSPPPVISVDVETISLKERIPIGFSIATSPHDAFYFTVFPEEDREIELVRPLLNNPGVKKVFHNALFDLRCFPLIYDIDRSNIADTAVMARLLGHTEAGLDDLAYLVNREAYSAKTMLGKSQTMLDIDQMEVAKKCCNDTKVTLALWHYLNDRIYDSITPEYLDIEMKAIPIVIDMGLRGIKIHQQDRDELQGALEVEGEFLRASCEAEGVKPGSNQQVGYVLAKRGNFLPMTKSKKQLKVASDQLEFLDDPLAMLILRYRHIVIKSLGTYIGPLEGHDRAFTNYNFDARVGRISSSKSDMPGHLNMQNIPGELRYIFLPDNGTFTSGDFSQQHTRLIMYFSQDRQMKRIFEEGEWDGDIHKYFADMMRVDRKLGKTINLAIPYGATAATLSQRLKDKNIRKCQEYLDFWFRTFPDAAEWIKEAQRVGLRDGWALPTVFGRRIKISEEYREGMMNKAVNYPVLGSDGEIMKRALVICKGYDMPLVVTVHDSITADGDVEFPVEELENIAPVRIPFDVKQTIRWE